MKPKYIIIILAVVTVITVFYSCKDNPINPPTIKSPRDYTWTVDTLGLPNTFQTLMMSIWGSSENDVYTCGHNSGNRTGNGDMWHFNGKDWEVVDLAQYIGGGNLSAVSGSSPKNVWAVGYQGGYDPVQGKEIKFPLIIQFDGIKWKQYKIRTKSAVYGIYVVSDDNVWACGPDGIVYHYKNSKWDIDTIKIAMNESDVFTLYNIVEYKSKIFTIGFKYKESQSWGKKYFYTKEGNNWNELDSFDDLQDPHKFGTRIISTPSQLYSVGSGGIYKWINNKWENIKMTQYPIVGLSSLYEKNIIAVGNINVTYYYNGNNWNELNEPKLDDIFYSGVWANKNEAFIIGFKQIGSVQKTLVLHGK